MFRLLRFFLDVVFWVFLVIWGENFGKGGILFCLFLGFFRLLEICLCFIWFFMVVGFGRILVVEVVCGFKKLNNDFEFLLLVLVFLLINLLICIFIFCIFCGMIFSCFKRILYCLDMIWVLFVIVGKVKEWVMLLYILWFMNFFGDGVFVFCIFICCKEN